VTNGLDGTWSWYFSTFSEVEQIAAKMAAGVALQMISKSAPAPKGGANRLARRRHELTITQTIDAAAGSSVAFVRRINWVVSRMVCVAEGEAQTCHGFGAQISIRRS
ncbi:MAG: hypothetical protein ACTS4Z_02355, partial [Candidatus Hodgkinia cicadicola]